MPNIHQNIRQLFTEIANAIRFKTGNIEKIKADDFPAAIDEIQVETIGTPINQSGWLSDTAAIIGYIKGDLSGGYKNSEVALVKSYCFQNHSNLTKISFPACSIVNNNAFINCSSLSWVSLDNTNAIGVEAFQNCILLQSITIPNCDALGSRAFQNCTSLETIYASGVRYIYTHCFQGCSSLKSVTLPSCTHIYNYSVFANCTALETVNLLAVQSIGQYAFNNCTLLQSIYFPSLTTIGYGAFTNCTNLETISTPLVKTVDQYAFNNCTKISYIEFYSATNIARYAFSNCTSLQSVYFPELKSIEEMVFYNCHSLTSFSFHPNAQYIGNGAFNNCYNLPSISLSMVTSIYYNAFANCTSLSIVSFPRWSQNGVMSSVFHNCTALKKVDFPLISNVGNYQHNNNITLESAWYSSASVVYTCAFKSCYMLSDLRLLNAISIYGYAFENCSSLSIVNLPNCNYMSIGAFIRCENLKQITLGNIVSLNDRVFEDCKKLESFSASTLTYIGQSAFKNCHTISYINTPNVTTILPDAFLNCYNLSKLIISTSDIGVGAYAGAGIQSIYDTTMSVIKYRTFQNCTKLSKVYFAKVHTIGAIAFYNTDLRTISSANFPLLTGFSILSYSYGDYSATYAYFANCKNLEYVDLPNVSRISYAGSYGGFNTTYGHGMFQGCDKLEYVNFQNLTYIQSVTNGAADLRPVFANGGFKKISLPKLSIYIPDMFNGCPRLEEVYLPLWSYITPRAFKNCSALSRIDNEHNLPSVKTIYSYAFQNCSNLEKVEFPNVTRISQYAFIEAFSNKSNSELILSKQNLVIDTNGLHMAKAAHMTLGVSTFTSNMWSDYGMSFNSTYYYNARSFVKTLTLPYCTTIGDYVMKYGIILTSVSIPVATTIGYEAFAFCWNLPSIDLPEVTNISSSAFQNCSMLSYVSAPKLTNIGSYAFQNCSNLEKVEFPNVTRISVRAFYNAYGNKSNSELILSKQNLIIDYNGLYMTKAEHVYLGISLFKSDFWSTYRAGDYDHGRQFTKKLTLPYCTTIDSYAMVLANNLVSISIPVATVLNEGAFKNCSSLPSIDLPEVTNISSSAFQNCSMLSYVSAPKLTNIGSYAFQSCSNLESIYMPKIMNIERNAFYGTGFSVIHIGDENKLSIIRNSTFQSCPNLEEIYIDNAVESIIIENYYTFANCPKLKKLCFSSGTRISNYTNFISHNGVTFRDSPIEIIDVNIPSIGANIYFPSTLKSFVQMHNTSNIVNYAFNNCNYLELSAGAFANMQYIYQYCFNNNQVVTSIHLPKISVLNYSTFASCPNLSLVRLDNIQTILNDVFTNSPIKSVYITTSVPPTISQYAFNGTYITSTIINTIESEYGSIYVKPEAYELFINARYFSNIKDRITSYTGLIPFDEGYIPA